jgi:hypothetical protein
MNAETSTTPACDGCREKGGMCFPRPCKLYVARVTRTRCEPRSPSTWPLTMRLHPNLTTCPGAQTTPRRSWIAPSKTWHPLADTQNWRGFADNALTAATTPAFTIPSRELAYRLAQFAAGESFAANLPVRTVDAARARLAVLEVALEPGNQRIA